MKTFYWHDYETWGANPAVDRPSQFAGVRTDEDLNIISEPLVMYCQPPVDIWPHPEACLVTGITPQKAQAEGLSEREFIARIYQELAAPETCGVGYNSLRFDDEVTRYTLYRNFYDPYDREWQNGNSRWDIIDMVRLTYALRPEGIEWPMVDDKPSFKLENLTAANGIAHTSAHDAYSDVEATIKIARLIKEKKSRIYDYVYHHRDKHGLAAMIDIAHCKPLLHISSKFPASRGCTGLIAPLAMHPVNKNAVIVYELSVDPSPLAELSPEEIRQRVFTSQEDLGETERLPIKLVHLNKCPVLATAKLLDEKAALRLHIDKTQCEKHWQVLRNLNVGNKVREMYRLDRFVPSEDPERQLYDGFVSDNDKRVMADVRAMDGDALASTTIVFEDKRLAAMLFRYRARNFYSSLSDGEREQWRRFVQQRLHDGVEGGLSYLEVKARIGELLREFEGESYKQKLLRELKEYVDARARSAKAG